MLVHLLKVDFPSIDGHQKALAGLALVDKAVFYHRSSVVHQQSVYFDVPGYRFPFGPVFRRRGLLSRRTSWAIGHLTNWTVLRRRDIRRAQSFLRRTMRESA